MAEQYETFDSVDAGASKTFPAAAGTVRKGGFIVINGHPCKVRHNSSCYSAASPPSGLSLGPQQPQAGGREYYFLGSTHMHGFIGKIFSD